LNLYLIFQIVCLIIVCIFENNYLSYLFMYLS